MKPLLPSLKEKKRYVVFEVMCDAQIADNTAYDEIERQLHTYVGDLGVAQAGLQFIRERWDNTRKRGIARVNHTSVDLLRASFVFIESMKNKKVIVRSLGVSGILAKAHQKYLAS
jgi:ribonuclease P/MRP protein subunit POP5